MDNHHPLLSLEETASLIQKAQAGDHAAVERLITHNQRLVYSIANRYYLSGFAGDLELEDIIQWGNIGLLRAISKYRPDFCFSTYASHWISGTIRRHARQTNTFGTTERESYRLSNIRRARSDLIQELGREPTRAEIAVKAKLPLKYVTEWLPALNYIISLDKPIQPARSDDENAQFYEATPDLQSEFVHEPQTDQLTELIHTLPTIQKAIIIRRYLIDPPQTYVQIAQELCKNQRYVKLQERQALSALHTMLTVRLNSTI